MLPTTGCSPTSTSEATSAKPGDVSTQQSPQLKQQVIQPQWPSLPSSDFANAKRDWVSSATSELTNVSVELPTVEETLDARWTADERLEFLVKSMPDMWRFLDETDQSCTAAVGGMCQRLQEVAESESEIQRKSVEILDTRIRWYRENSPNSPEIGEVENLQKEHTRQLTAIESCIEELKNRNFDSVESSLQYVATLKTVALEMPDVLEVLSKTVDIFKDTKAKTVVLKEALAKWGQAPILTELQEVQGSIDRIQQTIDGEQKRFDLFQRILAEDRNGIDVSDEEWTTLTKISQSIKKPKPTKLPKGSLELCARLGLVTGDEGKSDLSTPDPYGSMTNTKPPNPAPQSPPRRKSRNGQMEQPEPLTQFLQELKAGTVLNELKASLASLDQKKSRTQRIKDAAEAAVNSPESVDLKAILEPTARR